MHRLATRLVVVCCLAGLSAPASAQTPDTLLAAAKRDDAAAVRALLARTPNGALSDRRCSKTISI